MAQQVSKPLASKKMFDLSVSEDNDVSAQVTAHVTMALSTLDSRYKENVATYAQELHEYIHKIETVQISLDQIYKEKEPHSNALLFVEKEVDHAVRMLEYFSEQWIQKTVVVTELEIEMKQLDPAQKSDMLFQNRYDELKKLQQEIEDLEFTLLKHELERQNLLLKIEPIDHKINALQKSIRELESQKRYIESSYLHRITQVMPVSSIN